MSSPNGSTQKGIKIGLLRRGKVARCYKVRTNEFTIGSAPKSTMRVSGDDSIFSKHATIFVENNELIMVAEPGALVSVNDEPTDHIILEPFDIINIGRLSFRVEIVDRFDSVELPAPEKEDSLEPTKKAKLHSPPPSTDKGKTHGVPRSGDFSDQDEDAVSFLNEPRKPQEYHSFLPETKQELFLRERIPKDVATNGDSARAPIPKGDEKQPEESIEPDWNDIAEEPDDSIYFADDDEASFVPRFNLLDELMKDQTPTKIGAREPYFVAHMLRILEGDLNEVINLRRGQKYASHRNDLICRMKKSQLMLKLRATIQGEISNRGQVFEVAALTPKKGIRTYLLPEGANANLVGQDGYYNIEVYRPPKVQKETRWIPSSRFAFLCILSLVLHVVVAQASTKFLPSALLRAEAVVHDIIAEHRLANGSATPDMSQKRTKGDVAQTEKTNPHFSFSAIRKIRSHAKSNKKTTSVDSLIRHLAIGQDISGPKLILRENDSKTETGKEDKNILEQVIPLFSEIETDPILDRKGVIDTIDSRFRDITSCYQNALLSVPGLNGQILFHLTIISTGQVETVRAESATISNKKMTRCIKNIIKDWMFLDFPKESAKIVIPFLFRTGSK